MHKEYRGSPLSVHLTYSIFEEWAHFWDLNLALRFLGKVAGINGDAALKAAPSFLARPNIPLSLLSPHSVTVQSHTKMDPTLEERAGGGGKGVVSNRF
jgi:hypothetical protein